MHKMLKEHPPNQNAQDVLVQQSLGHFHEIPSFLKEGLLLFHGYWLKPPPFLKDLFYTAL